MTSPCTLTSDLGAWLVKSLSCDWVAAQVSACTRASQLQHCTEVKMSMAAKSQIEGEECRELATEQTCFTLLPAGLVEALVDAANDRDDTVSDAVFKSVIDIGRRKHVTVLEICLAYLTKHNKVLPHVVAYPLVVDMRHTHLAQQYAMSKPLQLAHLRSMQFFAHPVLPSNQRTPINIYIPFLFFGRIFHQQS